MRHGMIALVWLFVIAAPAMAQSTTPPPDEATKFWLVAGGGSTTFLGDCTGCEDKTYFHSGGVLTTIGGSINRRTDLGVEVSWVPTRAPSGETLYSTFIVGKVQFRPWASRGFFLNGGAGTAILKNYILEPADPARVSRSKALAVVIGAGWEFRVARRFGAELFASQHAAAVGDLTLTRGTVQDVLANYWSVGGAIVIR